MCHEEEMTPS